MLPSHRPGAARLPAVVPFLAALLLTSIPCLAQADDAAAPLAGTWTHRDEAAGETITLTLGPGGAGKLDDADITYTIKGKTLSVVEDGETTRYTFTVQGDSLTLKGGDLSGPTVFTRKGAARKTGIGSRIKKGSAPAPTPDGDADAPSPPQPKSSGLTGRWRANDGTVLEFRADGKVVYGGVAMPYKTSGEKLTIVGPAATIEWQYQLSGNKLVVTMDGEKQTLQRVSGGDAGAEDADAKDSDAKDAGDADKAEEKGAKKSGATGLAGNWNSDEGLVRIRLDGTFTGADGKDYKWATDGGMLNLSDDAGNWVKVPYKLDGDKLVLGTGPSKTLTRVKGGAEGVAGVYVGSEGSVDPTNVLTITQYLTLYPDGTVGFAKSEGGATRTQVSESIERFSSFKNGPGNAGRTYGRWKATGNELTIQWQGAFGNQTMRGRVNTNTLDISLPSGILSEGENVTFKRQ